MSMGGMHSWISAQNSESQQFKQYIPYLALTCYEKLRRKSNPSFKKVTRDARTESDVNESKRERHQQTKLMQQKQSDYGGGAGKY